MVVWLFQMRRRESTLDDIIPMGVGSIPEYKEFVIRLRRANVLQEIGDLNRFEVEYFNPMIFAIKKLGKTPDGFKEWPHIAFNREGTLMAFQGLGDKVLEL